MAPMPDPEPVMINFPSGLVEAELSTTEDVRRRTLKMKMKYRKQSFINLSSFPPTPSVAIGVFNPQLADVLSDRS
jgi:hypothetical protein